MLRRVVLLFTDISVVFNASIIDDELPDYTAQHPRRQSSSYSPPREAEFSQFNTP
jgi:hypothetical protein